MAIKLSEIRAKFPMYSDLSDDQLISGIRQKYYSDIPIGTFTKQIEYDTQRTDPTAGMSGVNKFRAGIGKGMSDTVRGIGQVVGAVPQQDIDETAKLDRALNNTGAGMAGNVAGNIALAIPTLAVPGASTLRGAALIGAAQGAAQPVETGQSRLQNAAIGGAAGAGGVAVGRGLAAGASGAKALAEPFTDAGRQRIAGRTIQRFADNPQAVRAVQGGPSATGAFPTLAEASGDAGMARLQDAARSLDPQIAGRIDARLAQNNSARVNSLRGMTGQDGGREFASQMRSGTAKDLYERAYSVPIELENLSAAQRGEMTKLMQMPAIQDALKVSRQNAKNFGMKLEGDGNIMGLHQAKLAMDDKIAELTGGGANQANKAAAIKAARDRLVTFMEAMSPDYRDARMTYAEMSKPINAMDTAAEVLRRGTSATSDLSGEPRLMPNSLMRALQDERALVTQATGRKGAGDLSAVMSPQDLALSRLVASETDRAGAVARAGNGPGSATAQRMASQNILRQIVGPSGLPESWAEGALANTLIGKPFNLIYGGVAEPRIQQALAEAVLDPAVARNALAAAQTSPRLPPNAMTQLLMHSARVAPSSAVAGQR
jgi:hypothetical protein